MIQMTGAPTGLLVTEGFRDEIELRRCFKEDIWDPALPARPTPIARRRVRLEIPERLTAEGDIDTPLDEDAVRQATRRLRALGVRSIAIVFLHSYVNPAHERRAREIVLEEFPDVELVSLLARGVSEATRVRAHVDDARERVRRPADRRATSTGCGHGSRSRLRPRTVDRDVGRWRRRRPTRSRTARSRRSVRGPTGGVVAAARAATAAGLGDVVSVDMGGTSYDVCLIRDGRPELKSDWNWRHRYCIALPMVDIHSIGAGGGSIARVRRRSLARRSRVGRQRPGPVCYGRGGTEPTVTDADLVLGRLDPAGFWGGRLDLDVDAATDALDARRARRSGLDARRDRGRGRHDRRRAHDRRDPAGAVARGRRPAPPRPRRVRRDGRGARDDAGRRARHAARARPRRGAGLLGARPAHRRPRRRRGAHARTAVAGRRSRRDSTRWPTSSLADATRELARRRRARRNGCGSSGC